MPMSVTDLAEFVCLLSRFHGETKTPEPWYYEKFREAVTSRIGELVIAEKSLPSPTPREAIRQAAETAAFEHRQKPVPAADLVEKYWPRGRTTPASEDGGPPYPGLVLLDGSPDKDSGLPADPASCPEGEDKPEAPGQGPMATPPE